MLKSKSSTPHGNVRSKRQHSSTTQHKSHHVAKAKPHHPVNTTTTSFHTTKPLLQDNQPQQTTTATTTTPPPTTPIKRKVKRGAKGLTPSTDAPNHQPIAASPHGVLGRDFVRESLYSKQGYFNASRVINSPGVISFTQLLGRAAYEKRLEELYYQGVQGWTTPVEIFQPHYAQSLARFFLQHLTPAVNQHSQIDYGTAVNLYEHVLKRMVADRHLDGSREKTKALDDLLTKVKHFNGTVDFWPSFGKSQLLLKDPTTLPDKADHNNIANVSRIHPKHPNTITNLPAEIDSTVRRFGHQELQRISRDPVGVDAETGHQIVPRIVEIGAGNGTCASNILDYLSVFHPQVYANTQYTIFEMSEQLSKQQIELLDNVHHGKYNVLNINAAEYIPAIHDKQQQQSEVNTDNTTTDDTKNVASKTKQGKNKALPTAAVEQKLPEKEHTFIFGLEVLDNMVHDKVIKGTDGQYYQVMVADAAYMDKLRQDHAENPQATEKVHKFRQYLHPNDEFDFYQKQQQDEQQQSSSSSPQQTKPPAPPPLEMTTTELLNYAFNKPLPIDYNKLNATHHNRGKLRFLEYAVPITDPVIAECLHHHLDYLSQSPYHNPDNQTGAINYKHQYNTSKDTDITNLGDKRSLIARFVDRVLSRKLLGNNEVLNEVVYLPTELLRFCHRVNRAFPSHTLLLADFDILPTTEVVKARNAPVVAKKAAEAEQRGKTIDEDTYLVELGQCDIFYPTDFNFLRHIYSNVVLKDVLENGKNKNNNDEKKNNDNNNNNDNKQQILDYDAIDSHISPYTVHNQAGTKFSHSDLVDYLSKPTKFRNMSIAMSQNEFLYKYASIEYTQCKNGFNPMMEDYNNMALFIGQRK